MNPVIERNKGVVNAVRFSHPLLVKGFKLNFSLNPFFAFKKINYNAAKII